MNGEKLMENKELRDRNIDRVDVLEHVKEILTLANTDFSTVELVSEYYEVDKHTVEVLIQRNREELKLDGLKLYKKSNIAEILANSENAHSVSFKIPSRGLILIPKRAILRIGMLLRNSEVAKEIRTRLLDIVHDAEEQTEIVIEEIRTEQNIKEDMIEAIISGDHNKLSVLQTELIGLKNKRISHLEDVITNSVTITESKAIINKCVRTIAVKKFNCMFGKAWDEFYRFINYKLGINVRNRKGKGLARFSDEEILKMEKIAKSWLEENDIDFKLVI
ncbi:TPA: hypothetical protein KRH68_000693 [Clostridioides difficile]|uniref:hypothetical protein n=1 Tax=Clostridioides difficile TaxID=1496 RepID=UPI000BD5F7C6|nr:hypothetical protein BGU81_07110 [Clostridioides difficile]HBF0795389.1 hypothetical protein [Clostridioides difficile]HBF7094230.1 hypothetical protein [Clostridioides difficile]HBG8638453.1 hypothetical protein [Clostridioides difficile]HCQ6142630.1 hypothetical protein [Clostridioides difficile]